MSYKLVVTKAQNRIGRAFEWYRVNFTGIRRRWYDGIAQAIEFPRDRPTMLWARMKTIVFHSNFMNCFTDHDEQTSHIVPTPTQPGS
jgi:hypothetical protein